MTVSLSPKYQVVIPKGVREGLGLNPGQKMQVFEFEGRIEIIPERPASAFRGFVSGIDSTFNRESDREV